MRLSRNGHIRRIVDQGVLCKYRGNLLLILNLSRSTPSNVNLTVYIHYNSSKSINLILVPSGGWRKPIQQRSLGFQLHVRESKVSNLEVVVRRSVVGERCDG